MEAAAKLYGQGLKRSQIARVMKNLLTSNTNPRTDEERLQSARGKLRRWEQSPRFRDLIYQYAVVKTDLALPSVLDGVTRKARRGRVDAAKLLLEITGRHSSRDGQGDTNVTVQIANIPRPD
jgi:hypothetical protein